MALHDGNELSVEDRKTITRLYQFRDTNRISAQNARGDCRRIIARPKHHSTHLLKLRQESFEIAVRRNQNKPTGSRVVQYSRIALTGETISQCALGSGEKMGQNFYELR